jgi:hypothetical protein
MSNDVLCAQSMQQERAICHWPIMADLARLRACTMPHAWNVGNGEMDEVMSQGVLCHVMLPSLAHVLVITLTTHSAGTTHVSRSTGHERHRKALRRDETTTPSSAERIGGLAPKAG